VRDRATFELAGYASYGDCRATPLLRGLSAHARLSADGLPIGFDLVAANISDRVAAAEILERLPLAGRTILADCCAPTAKTNRAATTRSARSVVGASAACATSPAAPGAASGSTARRLA
jgi:hypothetical protein